MLAKKSIETGEGCDAIPDSMRQYLAMYFDPSKPGLRDSFGRTNGYAVNGVYPSEASSTGKVGMSFIFLFFSFFLDHSPFITCYAFRISD